jgi:hypothetical protein
MTSGRRGAKEVLAGGGGALVKVGSGRAWPGRDVRLHTDARESEWRGEALMTC